jgi:preprotein translocase subunit SecG
MTFLALNWLSLSITLLLVVFVVVCLLMALLVLMQRPKQEGLGAAFGGGVTDQVFGARTTNVLQKGTVILASLFFIISFTLAILITKEDKAKSLLKPEKDATEVVENNTAPAAPEAPIQPTSLVDELPPETAPETDPTTETPAPTESTTEETPAPQENSGDKTE